MPQTFVKRSRIAASPDVVLAWHLRPEALEELMPPWEPVRLIERTGGPDRIGSRVVLRIGPRPFALRWVAEHTRYEPGRMFCDVQRSGPFARWEHVHSVEPAGPDVCWLEDRVEYELPFGWLGRLLGGRLARRRIERMFEYRHGVTRAAFAKTADPANAGAAH